MPHLEYISPSVLRSQPADHIIDALLVQAMFVRSLRVF